MKKHRWVSLLIVSTAVGTGWAAAKPKAKPAPKAAPAPAYAVIMQSAGTFDPAKPAAKLSIWAAPDEIEPASFSVKSSKPLADVTIKMADALVSGKNTIAAGSVVLSSMVGDRLLSAAPFDLQAGEEKRFWAKFDVPRRSVPGVYIGAVLAVSGGKIVGKLPVELNVLPMRLLTSSKQYGVILPAAAADESYGELLKLIKANGLGIASTAAAPEMLGDALRMMRSAGMGTPVPYTYACLDAENIAEAEKQARAAGVRRMLYTAGYQPHTPEEVQATVERLEILRKSWLKSVVVLDDPAVYDQLADSLDGVIYQVDMPYIQGVIAGEKRANDRNEWWYWDVSGSAKDNRLYAGLLLWKAGLDGALIPIDEPQSTLGTVQWEAVREGLDDTRYLTTFMSALREVKDALKVDGTKNATLAGKAAGDAEAYINAVMMKPLKDLTNGDYHNARWKLAQHIIALRKVLK